MAIYLKSAMERPEQDMRVVSDTVREILVRVRREGEAAVRYYSKKFDNWDPPSFRVSEEEVKRIHERLSTREKEDIDFCQAQIRKFAEKQREAIVDLEVETILAETGFEQVRIAPKDESRTLIREWAPHRKLEEVVLSATIEGVKPLGA